MSSRTTSRDKRPLLLIFSQTFVPDPAAVGQYMTDLAVVMARRGHRVRVYTSARGFEDPSRRYPRRECLHRVDVRRLPLSSFGKRSLLTRGFGTVTFLLQCLVAGLFTPRLGGIVFTTSPPMAGIAGTVIRLLRRVPTAYWAMDLNPDQLIALGKVKSTDWLARALELCNRFILRHVDLVIALDRFMADRLRARGVLRGKLLVIPPWPHEEHLTGDVPHEQNPFRHRHGLSGKFVVMYSGNHSPSNPLGTLLEVAKRLREDVTVRFLFVGGGHGKREVQEFVRANGLPNVLSLPYQPLEELRYSLSAADVHVVSLGNEMVGIIHPCKVYGAMAVARPVLFFGPRPSHIDDLLDGHSFGVRVDHGDVDAAERAVLSLRDMGPHGRSEMGRTGQLLLSSKLNMAHLCDDLARELEAKMPRPSQLQP